MPILEFCDVTKTYGVPGKQPTALREVTFALEEGDFGVLVGPSGAGKSTLLRLISAMERPETGTIRVAERDIHRLSKASIPYLRRNLGVVFQDFKLLPEAPALENVCLALQVLGLSPYDVQARARTRLEQVEIDPTSDKPVRCLSGGEQQRVALARALAGDPAVLLADEPTGNLDPKLTKDILNLLAEIRAQGTTVLVATHDPLVLRHAEPTRVFHIAAGQLRETDLSSALYAMEFDVIPPALPTPELDAEELETDPDAPPRMAEPAPVIADGADRVGAVA